MRARIFIALMIIGLVLFSGCIGGKEQNKLNNTGNITNTTVNTSVILPDEDNAVNITCENYCKEQPHVLCVGEWNISGEYPDCSCSFTCDVEEEPEIPEEIPVEPEEKINALDVPRVYSGASMVAAYQGNPIIEETPALCYLGAFAMLVMYNDPNIIFSDVVAYSGIGTHLEKDEQGLLTNEYKEESIMHAADGLGYSYNLGIKNSGTANSYAASFTSNASRLISFSSESEAIRQLEIIINSGRPLMVHLDSYYVRDDFAKISEFWKNNWEKFHSSHFMVVTGYNDTYVYINDPTEPDLSIKNMEAPIENFLDAWYNGDKVEEGAQLGPYWMLYLDWNTNNRTSVERILEWNYEISSDTYDEIKQSDNEGDFGELGVGRIEFGNFLIANGYEEAGQAYVELGGLYLTTPNIQEMSTVADLENEARDLLRDIIK